MLYRHDNVQVVTLADSPAAFTTPVGPASVSLLQLAHAISQAYYLQTTVPSTSPRREPFLLATNYAVCTTDSLAHLGESVCVAVLSHPTTTSTAWLPCGWPVGKYIPRFNGPGSQAKSGYLRTQVCVCVLRLSQHHSHAASHRELLTNTCHVAIRASGLALGCVRTSCLQQRSRPCHAMSWLGPPLATA